MKNVIKLIVKCIIVIAPFIAFYWYASSHLMSFADEEVPYYLWNKEICRSNGDSAEIIFLGDSVSNAGYAPELLSDSSINLALGGTTPVEHYYVLKEYLHHHDAPDIIYYTVNDNHFHEEDSFYKRVLYSHRFDYADIRQIIADAKRCNEPSIITDTYLDDVISYELYLPSKYVASFTNGGINQRRSRNEDAYQLISEHRGRYISVTDRVNIIEDEIHYDDFIPAPLFDEYYRKVLDLCEEAGITTIRLVKTPLDSNVSYSENYPEELYGYYEEILSSYPGTSFFWVNEAYGHEYFSDPIHLNENGCRRFSETIKQLYPEDF